MLYDYLGRQLETPKKPETREIAVTDIRDRWSTYPSSGLTPRRLASIFKQADAGDVSRQAELFTEMEEKDAHLFSQFQTRKLAASGLDWNIAPPNHLAEDAQARKIAEEAGAALAAVDLDELILDLLDALPKGYSLVEILWDASAGQAGFRDLRHVDARKVSFWQDLTPRLLTEREPAAGEELAQHKFMYHRYKARSGYDTRAGILRVCAWMYLFKNYAIKDWVGFAEVYGQPFRVGKYAAGATESDKDALLQAVRNLGSDAAGIISKSTEIEFIEASKTSSADIYDRLAHFCDAQMSKAILGQTLTSEAGGEKGQGSYSLGQVHNEVRLDLLAADARSLSRTLTRQLLRPWAGFNFGWDAPCPVFELRVEAPEDMGALATVYAQLATMGQPISREHISERFGVPLPGKDETPVSPYGQAQQPGAEPEASSLRMMAAEQSPTDARDILAAKTHKEITGADRLAEQAEQLLAECANLKEFQDRLWELYRDAPVDALADAMQVGLALAELSGRYDVGGPDAR